ncbi:MAG: DUF4143 domain-containing protein [Oligoflexia bacterium]|nr:DUF4143 domain-containing protein [Oligoflexia bacterium]
MRERKHPKLYWVDPGIVRAARGDYGPVSSEERGSLLEGWVAQTLRSCQGYFDDWDEMFYWAPSEAKGIEVDFLLRGGRKFVAIEVKSGSRIRPEWFTGLEAIRDLKGVGRRIVVYLGLESITTDTGIEVLTLADFLKELESRKLV